MGTFVSLVQAPVKEVLNDILNNFLLFMFLVTAAIALSPALTLPFVILMRFVGISIYGRFCIDILIIFLGFFIGASRPFVGISRRACVGIFIICFGLSALTEGAVLNLLWGTTLKN